MAAQTKLTELLLQIGGMLKHERVEFRFCTQCGVISKIGDDGTCAYCGCDTCELGDAINHLTVWSQRQ